MMTLPPIRRKAPSTHCHIGSLANSCNRTGICVVARAAMMDGTMVKKGPNARANIRVRICDGSAGLIATSIGATPNAIPTSGRYTRPMVGIADRRFESSAARDLLFDHAEACGEVREEVTTEPRSA